MTRYALAAGIPDEGPYKAGSMLYIFDNKARTLPRRRRKESAIIDKALLSYPLTN